MKFLSFAVFFFTYATLEWPNNSVLLHYNNFQQYLKTKSLLNNWLHCTNKLKSQDYKEQEVAYLRSSGKTEEEIAQYFQEKKSEKALPNDDNKSDVKQLKLEIERLKQDMKILKEKVGI